MAMDRIQFRFDSAAYNMVTHGGTMCLYSYEYIGLQKCKTRSFALFVDLVQHYETYHITVLDIDL